MIEQSDGYFEFFGERINPDLHRDQVKAVEAYHAENDAKIFSGDFGPIGDMDAFHESLETLRLWLANTDFDELEEVEEVEED